MARLTSIVFLCFMGGAAPAVSNPVDVARACVKVSEYSDELGFVAYSAYSKTSTEPNSLFISARTEFRSALQLFRIVAGENARKFAFEEEDGIYGIEKIVESCIEQQTCNKEVVSVVRGFSFFLIEACKSDFGGSL